LADDAEVLIMRVVLTGATGFIGAATLRHLVDRPDVTKVTCLVRRPVPVDSDKVESLVLDDFMVYDSELVARLAGHDACIWALGSRFAPGRDKALHERLTVGYPLAFVEAVAADDCRFCYVSGWGTKPASLKGRAEIGLREVAAQRPGLDVFCFRPAKVLPQGTNALVRALYGSLSVEVDALVQAMIRVALDEPVGTPEIIENKQIRTLGR
jgi:nucleoside-diphosphate-sugar epimerase